MDYHRFLGSDNFKSDDLGYLFLVHRAEKLAIKFMYEDITIERSSDKNMLFSELL
jgi:hypothetical protein